MTDRRDERLTRERWVKAGLVALAEYGEAGVRIDVIAKTLRISRGSFYWHFDGRPEFLSAILDEWRASATTLVHEQLNAAGLSPIDRLERLLELAVSEDQRAAGGRVEQAVSHWATYSAEAEATLRCVHQERLTFINSMMEELGVNRPKIISEILYMYVVGHGHISRYLSNESPRSKNSILEILKIG